MSSACVIVTGASRGMWVSGLIVGCVPVLFVCVFSLITTQLCCLPITVAGIGREVALWLAKAGGNLGVSAVVFL